MESERIQELLTERAQLRQRIAELELELDCQGSHGKETLFPKVLEALPVGVWILDSNGKVLLGNSAGKQIWGREHFLDLARYGELKGWSESGKPIAPEEWAAVRALQKGETILNEGIRIEASDGTQKFILDSAIPLREESGEIGGAIVVNQDITKQQQSIEAMLDSEKALRTIFDGVNDGIIVLDAEGNLVDVNEKMLEMYGFDLSEIGRLSIARDLSTPNNPLDELPGMLKRASEGEALLFDWEAKRKDGVVFQVEVFLHHISLHHRDYVLATLRDITKRKQSETQLQNLKHRFELILNSAGEGIFGLDQEGKLTFANPAATRMLGYEVEEMLGKNMHSLIHHTRADGSPYPPGECPNYRTVRDGLVTRSSGEYYWRKDGSPFPMEYIGAPIKEDDRITGSVILFQDITERERERHQQQQIEALKQTDKLKDQFLGIISHELRTPINVITGFGSILEDGIAGPLTEKQHAYLQRILIASDNLLSLVNDLLDMTRIQAGRFGLTYHPMCFQEVTRNVIENLAPLAKQSHLQLVDEVPEDLPELDADEQRISQVLMNLVSNAIKFSKPGDAIRIRAFLEEHRLVCEVQDTGIGIAPQDLSKLFTRFMQLDMGSTRRRGGTGLGLSISKALIEAHGGTISALSPGLGKGSTFRFELPLEPHAPEG